MNIPERAYAWIFAEGGLPQFNYSYDTQGRVVLEGVAPISAKVTDNAWTIQATPVISPVNFSWYYSAGLVNITGISGLTPGTTYSIKFLVIT